MTDVLALTPVTTPLLGSTVATVGEPLDHTPPVVADAKVVVTPAQLVVESVPVIGATTGITHGAGTVVTLVIGLSVNGAISHLHLVEIVIELAE
jgi:hypothetical protein